MGYSNMFRSYRGVELDPNQDLTYERKKLYNIGTAILNGDNDDNHHNKKKKKNKNKKLSKKEYIERLEMQEKWFAHYGRNKWY